jgi:hypothetical protein
MIYVHVYMLSCLIGIWDERVISYYKALIFVFEWLSCLTFRAHSFEYRLTKYFFFVFNIHSRQMLGE